MNTNTISQSAPRSHPLVDLLLTTDPRRRTALSLCLLSTGLYIGFLGLIWLYLVPNVLSDQEQAWNWAFTIHQLIAIGLFYPLIRSGLTLKYEDPGLVALQIIWASAAVVLGYAVAPVMRVGNLQILCLAQVFGFVSLRPRAALLTGGATIGMLLAMWAIMSALHGPHFNPADEAFQIFPTCLILGLLAWQSRNFGRSRERMAEEKTRLASATERVRQIARHDPLTGLFNRQYLQTRLDAEHDRAGRSGSSFCIAVIDLDHFKNVNDTHGHHVGDEVLLAFAQQARTSLRETDLIGRWGGEEFVVVMPETDPAQAGTIGLSRLKEALCETGLSARVPSLRVTFSAGLAALQPGESSKQLLQRADEALYLAKAQGRNRAVIAG
ncbi:GGDEF domain-containing protein [Aquabacterium sp.]|uniref:GGDEF domain-containing protein n=1 Tax=Aquabacterium sp. TaxID=1872578 RepID=UPI00248937F2|nr:GGDEF domain-containing protein [Aquabacterium sp.]MDI1261003.1 GGDEF domain-containing protein [Aquabacterium sp.]